VTTVLGIVKMGFGNVTTVLGIVKMGFGNVRG